MNSRTRSRRPASIGSNSHREDASPSALLTARMTISCYCWSWRSLHRRTKAEIVWVSAPGNYALFNSNHIPDGTPQCFETPALQSQTRWLPPFIRPEVRRQAAVKEIEHRTRPFETPATPQDRQVGIAVVEPDQALTLLSAVAYSRMTQSATNEHTPYAVLGVPARFAFALRNRCFKPGATPIISLQAPLTSA
jgi:hypothetical protein